jgi:hypothetical protein
VVDGNLQTNCLGGRQHSIIFAPLVDMRAALYSPTLTTVPFYQAVVSATGSFDDGGHHFCCIGLESLFVVLLSDAELDRRTAHVAQCDGAA